MIQEHGGLETEANKVDAEVPDYAKDEVGAGKGCPSWETNRQKAAISSLNRPSSIPQMAQK